MPSVLLQVLSVCGIQPGRCVRGLCVTDAHACVPLAKALEVRVRELESQLHAAIEEGAQMAVEAAASERCAADAQIASAEGAMRDAVRDAEESLTQASRDASARREAEAGLSHCESELTSALKRAAVAEANAKVSKEALRRAAMAQAAAENAAAAASAAEAFQSAARKCAEEALTEPQRAFQEHFAELTMKARREKRAAVSSRICLTVLSLVLLLHSLAATPSPLLRELTGGGGAGRGEAASGGSPSARRRPRARGGGCRGARAGGCRRRGKGRA